MRSPASDTSEKWKIQFFYDKADSTLEIRDLQCGSTTTCVAAGAIDDKKGHSKPVVVRTTDGGKTWNIIEAHEQPVSLFFLNATQGWMVTEKGLWGTLDSGATWKKLEGKKGLLQAYFLDPMHGFVIGFPKAVYETRDGGDKLTLLPAAEKPATPKDDTVYESISFLGQHGLIVGGTSRDSDDPVWLDPTKARMRRQQRSTLIALETNDGGTTWNAHTSLQYGNLTQLALTKDGPALALFEYHDYYSLASRLYRVQFPAPPVAIYGERDRAVTDFALLADGQVILAAVEPPGASNQIPIPGKLKMLRSTDLKTWEEMPVDYRAVAQQASLAAPDRQHLWVATDTGMILTLEK